MHFFFSSRILCEQFWLIKFVFIYFYDATVQIIVANRNDYLLFLSLFRTRSSNKVPPGAVNLERSYQICQAVIQNSPNRDALRGQLRPPPALLTRPARAPRPPPPVLVRQIPASVMPHTEVKRILLYKYFFLLLLRVVFL